MSTSDFHEATFKWPHKEALSVTVTGSFDSWSGSIHAERQSSGYFQATVKVPWGQKISYKYIVDGVWTTTDNQPTEWDPIGNLNNVYMSPARPVQPKVDVPPVVPVAKASKPQVQLEPVPPPQTNGVMTSLKDTAVGMVEAIAPGTTTLSQDTPVQTPAEKPVSPTVTESVTSTVTSVVTAVSSAAQNAVDTAKAAVSTAPAAQQEEVPTPEPASEPSESAAPVIPEPAPEAEKAVSSEAVLPAPVEEIPIAPVVPVPILPLAPTEPAPVANGHTTDPLKTTVVNGAATAASTEPVPEVVEASTHGPAVEPPAVPAAVPLPLPTPSEVPVPETPAANGVNGSAKASEEHKQAEAPAAPLPTTNSANGVNGAHKEAAKTSPSSSPPHTPHKEKRAIFPTLGRHSHSRRSSSMASNSDHELPTSSKDSTSSPKGSVSQKRKSSFFGKVKNLFHHDHDHDHDHKEHK